MHSKDDEVSSKWAVVLDPGGAAFGLIPTVPAEVIAASPHEGSPIGRICWLDLTVDDAASRRDFYRQVIGWSVQNVNMANGGERYADFNMLAGDGSPAAGVCHARGSNADLPAVWMIYLPVADLAESLRRVPEEGGRVIKAAQSKEGEYLYAAIRDPVGAHFALIPG